MSATFNMLFDDGQHWRVPASEVRAFRDLCLRWMPTVRAFSHRIALCLWFDLLLLNKRFGIAPPEVLQPLLDLENGEPEEGLKPATPFNRKPLKGLWHKHWFSARFLAANMLAAMERGDPVAWIGEIVAEGEILTEEVLGRIVERLTTTSFEDRFSAKQVTGEWIIFAKREGENHYLCLGTHETGDERIYEKIERVCSLEYPDITSWIAEAARAQVQTRSRETGRSLASVPAGRPKPD